MHRKLKQLLVKYRPLNSYATFDNDNRRDGTYIGRTSWISLVNKLGDKDFQKKKKTWKQKQSRRFHRFIFLIVKRGGGGLDELRGH
jgi:hypothetical protein